MATNFKLYTVTHPTKVSNTVNVNQKFNYENSEAYTALKSIMLSLKVLGLHHTKVATTFNEEKSKCGIGVMPLKLSGWIIAIIVCCYLVITMSTLQYNGVRGEVIIYNLLSTIWILQCAVNIISIVKASHNFNALPKLFLLFDKLQSEYGGILTNLSKFKKLSTIVCVFLWSFYILGVVSYLYIFCSSSTQLFQVVAPTGFAEGTTYAMLMKISFAVLNLYGQPVLIFLTAFEVLVAYFISTEFRLSCKSFSNKIDDKGHFSGCMESERRRYLEMTRIVKAADRSLSLHYAASFSCNITTLGLLIYSLLYYPDVSGQMFSAIAFTSWGLASTIDLICVCISGISVKTSVRYTFIIIIIS